MSGKFSNLQWKRILPAGLLVYILTFLGIFIVVTGYAFKLGFEARGAPDQELIGEFANQVSGWLGPLLATLFAILMASWVARKSNNEPALNGLLVGLVAAIISLAAMLFRDHPIGLATMVQFGSTLLAGWIGGVIGGRRNS